MNRSGAMQIAGVYELAIANTKVFIIQAQQKLRGHRGEAKI
jgi:hypothetical protein